VVPLPNPRHLIPPVHPQFSILTISQLANEVAMIIDYFSVRTKARRQRWRDKYENSIRELQRQKNPHASLEDEVELLEEISNREELMAEVWDLAWSLGSLIVFWMAGAAIFSAIEPGWTFGDALYFQVVFCLTIGR
jgi:potassium channel subfamily K, other eukaryote